jgi:hypothetical protein
MGFVSSFIVLVGGLLQALLGQIGEQSQGGMRGKGLPRVERHDGLTGKKEVVENVVIGVPRV